MNSYKKIDGHQVEGSVLEQHKKEMLTFLIQQSKGEIPDKELKAYIVNLIKAQDEDGFWGYYSAKKVPADIRVYYVYEPSYVAVAILMNYKYNHPEEATKIAGFREVLSKGMQTVIGRKFSGRAYEEMLGTLYALNAFAYGKAWDFILCYPDYCPDFNALLESTTMKVDMLLGLSLTKNEWGQDYGAEMLKTMELIVESREH